MRKSILISLLIIINISAFSQKNNVAELLLPQPASVISAEGAFVVNNTTSIHLVSMDPSAKRVAGFLSKKLSVATGYPVQVVGVGR